MKYKVVGPPGTGKTRRLLNEVQKYVDKGVPGGPTTLYFISNYFLFFQLVCILSFPYVVVLIYIL